MKDLRRALEQSNQRRANALKVGERRLQREKLHYRQAEQEKDDQFRRGQQQEDDRLKYNDAATVQERLAHMDVRVRDDILNTVTNRREHLKDCGLPINNNQAAVVASVLEGLCAGRTKQIVTVPAGHGKSRITPALIDILCRHYNKRKFRVVFAHDQLLRSDREAQHAVISLLGGGTTVDYVCPRG